MDWLFPIHGWTYLAIDPQWKGIQLSTAIESLDDVRPGDIMICSQADAPARVLVNLGQLLLKDHFRIGEFTAGHAGIVVPNGKLVEAMPSGALVRDLRKTDWSPTHAYLRLPEDYSGQADHASLNALAMVGTPYSFMSYAYLGAYIAGFQPEFLADWIDRRESTIPNFIDDAGIEPARTIGFPVEAICSVLAEQAWTLAGKKVIEGTRPQVVTPGMLTGQLWTRPGVIRGGMGLVH